MWAIENQTSFAAERTFVRDRDGAEIWLVAVRATFTIYPDGTLEVAKDQSPVVQSPLYHARPGQSSLRYDTDLPATKCGTDVVLNASAHVPEGSDDVAELLVGFRLGSIQKNLRVRGKQSWEKTWSGLNATPPERFRVSPIRYECALGGKPEDVREASLAIYSQRNPVGTGLARREGECLPTIHNCDDSMQSPNTRRPVAGFGPIAGHWSPRRELAGTYDADWQKRKRPLLPDDFQSTWYQSAPADQIVDGFLRGGEAVELRNLTPAGLLRFRLPQHTFGFRTWIGGTVEQHRANLHSVILEPDESRLIMVWHSALPCHHTLYMLKQTVVFEKSRLTDAGAA